MVTVVRLGPLPLRSRRAARLIELERIFGTVDDLIDVTTLAELAVALRRPEVVAIALDAFGPEDVADAIAAAGSLPVLRPLWRSHRNTRGEVDEVFDGYGLLAKEGILGLADGELSPD